MKLRRKVEEIDRMIQESEVSHAISLAKSELRFNEDTNLFNDLINALITARRIRELKELYRRYPNAFRNRKNALAVLYFRTLKLKKLYEVLPEVDASTRGWIYAALGFVEKAKEELKRIGSNSLLTAYLDIFSGREPTFVSSDQPSSMMRIYEDYLQAFLLIFSGFIHEGLELLNSVSFRAFSGGYVGWGVDTLLVKGLVTLNPTEVEAARQIAHQVYDRFSEVTALLYLALFGADIPKVPPVPRLTVQRDILQELLEGNLHLPNDCPLFGYRAMWWYVDKFFWNKIFISFAGRVRIFKGKEELRFPRHRKSMAVLAFSKILGREGKNFASIIFPNSADPKRRYLEYLGRLGDIRHAATDFPITKRYGTFLAHEEENWAKFLKEKVKTGL
ncbi:MAG: hypothetical protein GXO39_07340 [Thermotogae bacterium]|nr:hypothetical protein [Thermotogota bacterium]